MNDSPGWASPGSDNSGTSSSDAPDTPGLPRPAGPPDGATPPGSSPASSHVPEQAANGPDEPATQAGEPGEPSAATGDTAADTPSNTAGGDTEPSASQDADPATPPEAPGQPPAPGGPVPPNWSAAQPPAASWSHTPPPGADQPVPPPPPGPNAGMGGGTGSGPYSGGPYPGGPYPGGGHPGGYPGGPYPGPQQGWGHPGGPGGPNPYWIAPPPPPKPGVIPLRPLDIGDIFNGAFAIIRVHWRKVLGISFVVSLVLQIVQTVLSRSVWNGSARLLNESQPTIADMEHFYRSSAPALAGSVGLSLLAQVVAMSMLTIIVSRSVIGRPVALGEVWREARPRMLWMLGLLVTMILIVALLVTVCVLPGAAVALAGSDSGGAALTLLGALAAGCLVVWMMVPFSLSIPIIMLEKQGIFASLGRSYKLVRRSWWRIFGTLLLAVLLTSVVGALIQSPFAAITTMMNGTSGSGGSSSLLPSLYDTTGWGFAIFLAIGGTIAATFTLPMSASIVSLLYIDRRIRTEGLDVDLARAAGIEGYPGK